MVHQVVGRLTMGHQHPRTTLSHGLPDQSRAMDANGRSVFPFVALYALAVGLVM